MFFNLFNKNLPKWVVGEFIHYVNPDGEIFK